MEFSDRFKIGMIVKCYYFECVVLEIPDSIMFKGVVTNILHENNINHKGQIKLFGASSFEKVI